MSFNIEDYYTYRSDYKTYSVQFVNEEQLKIFDVKNIFNEFGEMNVVQTKSPTGYCFVNFYSLEDARKCVQGMKNHPSKIKLTRPKKRDPLPNQENQTTGATTKSSGISERLKVKPLSSEDVSKLAITSPVNLAKLKPLSKEPKTLKEAIASMSLQFQMLDEQKTKETTTTPENKVEKSSSEISEEEKKGAEEEEKIVVTVEEGIKVRETAENEREEEDKLKHDTRSTSSISQMNSTEKIVTPINGSVSSTPDKLEFSSSTNGGDEIFHHNQAPLKAQSLSAGKPCRIIEAQEVVVADIPEEFGTFDILCLFKEYQPIFISEVKRIASLPDVRYCHVYFSSVRDAENAEIYFDGMELGQQEILVLQPESLAQQATLA